MINLSKFGERLKELMDEKEINAPALGKILNTDRTNITRYLKGERAPRYETFISMLKYFNCSADYLLGLKDIPPDNQTFNELPPFGERLRYVISYCGSSQYKLENENNFSGSEIYNWLFGIKLPSVPSLVKLSEDLGCTVDFLIGRDD